MKGSREGCCRVDAVVSVDSKGQIVLPKELRDKANLKQNDKLAIIGIENGDELCCIMMVKADRLGNSVKKMLGPMLKDVLGPGGA